MKGEVIFRFKLNMYDKAVVLKIEFFFLKMIFPIILINRNGLKISYDCVYRNVIDFHLQSFVTLFSIVVVIRFLFVQNNYKNYRLSKTFQARIEDLFYLIINIVQLTCLLMCVGNMFYIGYYTWLCN